MKEKVKEKRRERRRREKKQEKRRDKMKREKMKEKRGDKMKRRWKGEWKENEEKRKEGKDDFFQKNVSRPSNPSDESAQNISKKIPFGRIIPPFFLQKFRIWPFFSFIYMIRIRFLGPGELNQNYFRAAQYLTAPQNQRSYRWMLVCAWMVYLRSTCVWDWFLKCWERLTEHQKQPKRAHGKLV